MELTFGLQPRTKIGDITLPMRKRFACEGRKDRERDRDRNFGLLFGLTQVIAHGLLLIARCPVRPGDIWRGREREV